MKETIDILEKQMMGLLKKGRKASSKLEVIKASIKVLNQRLIKLKGKEKVNG